MRFVLVLAVVMAVGCGGPGSVDGEILGQTLNVKSSALVDQSSNGITFQFLLISDNEDVCSVFKANRYPKGSKNLFIALNNLAGDNQLPLTTGDYTFATPARGATGKFAFGEFTSLDLNCASTVPTDRMRATSGLATVESIETGKHISGQFDVTFDTRVTGTFNAEWCPVPVSSSRPTCE